MRVSVTGEARGSVRRIDDAGVVGVSSRWRFLRIATHFLVEDDESDGWLGGVVCAVDE